MRLRRLVIIFLITAVVGAGIYIFLCGKGKGLSLPAPVPGSVAAKNSPNVVLVIIDTLRADHLGCYGFEGKISPEIDEMATHGVLFENAIAQCSWTRPSIASMLTSIYPRSTGIVKEGFDILHDRYLTLAETLKKSGFKTIGITANPTINSAFNFQQGFDTYIDSWVIWKWMKPKPGQKKRGKETELPRSDEIFAKLLEHIEPVDKKPVYVQINVMDVHQPFNNLREEYRQTYDNFKNYRLKSPPRFIPEDSMKKMITGTQGAVRQVSHDLDVFVKKLRSIPGWDNTLFIITSDHGQGLDDHPDVRHSVKHGYLLYESQVRVPFIFYHPVGLGKISFKLKQKRVRQKVRLLDLMPTVLDYVGLPVPGKIHGKSFLPLLEGENATADLPGFFVCETNWRKVSKVAVYSDDWKYIENRDGWGKDKGVNPIELQPVGIKENGLLTDKISDKTKAKIVREMKKYLYTWEKKYRKVKRSSPRKKIPTKVKNALKSLGYLNDNKRRK